MKHGVDPSSSLNVIKTCNHNLELLVELLIKFLNGLCVVSYLGTWYSVHYEVSCNLGLVITDVVLSVQKAFY